MKKFFTNATIYGNKHYNNMVLPLLFIAVLVMALIFCVVPVSATDAPPDATMTIVTTKVFRDIYQSGDILFVLEYNIPYTTTTPPVNIINDYEVGLYDVSNTTLITTPEKPVYYVNYNMASIYFSASDVSSYHIVWNTNYWIRVEATNQVSPAPNPAQHQYSGSDWVSSDTVLANNQLLLRSYLTNTLVKDLQIKNNVTYLASSTQGLVLNNDGRNLVLTAIPYLDTPIPSMFQLSISEIPITQPVSSGALQNQLTISNQLGSAINTAFTNFGNTIHVSGQMVAMGWIMICVLIIISIVFLNTGNIIGASICAIPMGIIGIWIGAIPLAFVFVAVMVIVLFFVYYMFIRGM
jgi:hypothetical protein